MPIPTFAKDGFLPPGIHSATMAELERKFGFSPKRRSLIESGLKPVVKELRVLGFPHLFLGGSFVSIKLSPGDIDGYVLTRLDSNVLNETAGRQENWRARYQVDINLAFTDLEGYGSKEYWQSLFEQADDDPPKKRGIIKLILGR
jgi:hypothetical protein